MSKKKVFDMELFFAALADRTRLRLLNLMSDDEVCVCFFAEVIGTNQPKISRHLAYLRKAGLVSVRRDWKWAHYRITEPENERAAKVLREILEWLKDDQEMRQDRKQMMKVCCAPVQQQPISIQGAPLPKRIKEQATV
jgi:ArsR family transcriptional regulator